MSRYRPKYRRYLPGGTAKAARVAVTVLLCIKSNWRCVHCGAPLIAGYCLGEDADFWREAANLRAATIDHIEPVAISRDNSLDNLQASCAPCNRARKDNPRTDKLGRLVRGDNRYIRRNNRWELEARRIGGRWLRIGDYEDADRT
jgi:5-methylcytosine-specific restriction endonuclease McrA